jgi:hypothetical protein
MLNKRLIPACHYTFLLQSPEATPSSVHAISGYLRRHQATATSMRATVARRKPVGLSVIFDVEWETAIKARMPASTNFAPLLRTGRCRPSTSHRPTFGPACRFGTARPVRLAATLRAPNVGRFCAAAMPRSDVTLLARGASASPRKPPVASRRLGCLGPRSLGLPQAGRMCYFFPGRVRRGGVWRAAGSGIGWRRGLAPARARSPAAIGSALARGRSEREGTSEVCSCFYEGRWLGTTP